MRKITLKDTKESIIEAHYRSLRRPNVHTFVDEVCSSFEDVRIPISFMSKLRKFYIEFRRDEEKKFKRCLSDKPLLSTFREFAENDLEIQRSHVASFKSQYVEWSKQ